MSYPKYVYQYYFSRPDEVILTSILTIGEIEPALLTNQYRFISAKLNDLYQKTEYMVDDKLVMRFRNLYERAREQIDSN